MHVGSCRNGRTGDKNRRWIMSIKEMKEIFAGFNFSADMGNGETLLDIMMEFCDDKSEEANHEEL